MALFETVLVSDLKKPIQVKALTGNLFSADNNGNKITVSIMDNGAAAEITGNVTGYVIRADGKTVVVDGELVGNMASIVLPASAYAVIGRVSIVVKVGATTVGACTSNVYRSTTDEIVDPGTVIPSITALMEQIAAAIEEVEDVVDSIPPDYTELVEEVNNKVDMNHATQYTPSNSATFDYGTWYHEIGTSYIARLNDSHAPADPELVSVWQVYGTSPYHIPTSSDADWLVYTFADAMEHINDFQNNIADIFYSGVVYEEGNYVTRNGVTYKRKSWGSTTPVAKAWSASDWEKVEVANNLSEKIDSECSALKSATDAMSEVVNFQVELTSLGNYETATPFHTKAGETVTIESTDGNQMTATQIRFVRPNFTTDYWAIAGYTKRTINITEEFIGVYLSGGTASPTRVTRSGSYLNFQPQIDETNAAINTAKIYTLGVLGNKSSGIMPVTIYNGYKQKTGNGYFNADGTVTENASWQYCSDFIPIMPNASYSAWGVNAYIQMTNALILWYSIDKVLISRSSNTVKFISPANAYYCKISINYSGSQPMFISGTTTPGFYRPYSIKFANDTDSVAERNIQNVSNGNLPILNSSYNYEDISVTEEDGYINNAGFLYTGNTWKHIEVNVEGGNTYYFEGSSASACYAMMIFDDYQLIQTIPASLGSGSHSQNVKMPGNAKRVIINKSSTGIVLKKAVSISLVSENILYGKKLYCGGDSITEAVNVGSFPNGYKKSYAGYVANRNNMVYVSDGIGGSCMGNVMIDGWNYNAFCVNRYQNIPTDADYITLWFGWNDNAYGWKSMREAYCVETYGAYYSALTETQKAEVDAYKTWRQWLVDYVGTVDSTSDKTWRGAWSKVLTWLLDNCPSSRIGVIVAYGMYEELSTALIAICEKYGVSYVKTYDPHEFFSVGHSHGIGEDQAVKRKQLYTLDNTHPNELGYEMISTSYEKFLRGL